MNRKTLDMLLDDFCKEAEQDIIKELPDTCRGSAAYNLTHKICNILLKKKNVFFNALEENSSRKSRIKPY